MPSDIFLHIIKYRVTYMLATDVLANLINKMSVCDSYNL